jgi:hypothetical protein
MKPVSQLAGLAVALTIMLVVAAEVLPRLVVPAAVLIGLAIIGRLVWFYTQKW